MELSTGCRLASLTRPVDVSTCAPSEFNSVLDDAGVVGLPTEAALVARPVALPTGDNEFIQEHSFLDEFGTVGTTTCPASLLHALWSYPRI